MEIVIIVLVALAFIALALIPRFIALRDKRRGAPTLTDARAPGPVERPVR